MHLSVLVTRAPTARAVLVLGGLLVERLCNITANTRETGFQPITNGSVVTRVTCQVMVHDSDHGVLGVRLASATFRCDVVVRFAGHNCEVRLQDERRCVRTITVNSRVRDNEVFNYDGRVSVICQRAIGAAGARVVRYNCD